MANLLKNSTSPYLLQHANNPVFWRPWNSDTLTEARSSNKLMIVSIGYSACHWCHVMEHESFEDQEVANLMNEHFISVKIDREERPDIDQLYMDAVHLMNQQGGWPLNVICLPDGRPIYGGTYFPKQKWMQLLNQLAELWKFEPAQCEEYGFELTQGLRQLNRINLNLPEPSYSTEVLAGRVASILEKSDLEKGGHGGAPKFPMPVIYRFLLRYGILAGNNEVIDQAIHTLNCMAAGGIYDQLGGGFSRYSTDREWKVPHFEKMLYDNGQLIRLYSEAFRITGDELYRKVVYETIGWIMRDLKAPNGGYFSATDADTDGVEGKFYVWTPEEVDSICGLDSEATKAFFGIGTEGYWEHGNSVPVIAKTVQQVADSLNQTPEQTIEQILRGKQALFDARNERTLPGIDTKILLSWNALLICGFAEAGLAFKEPEITGFAEDLYQFLKENLITGRWKRVVGEEIPAFAEDRAAMIDAALALHQTTWNPNYLLDAEAWMKDTIENFYDENQRVFLFSNKDEQELIAPKIELTDNVIPAPNSTFAIQLFQLGNLLGNAEWLKMSEDLLQIAEPNLDRWGAYGSNWHLLYTWKVFGHSEIAVVGTDVEKAKMQLQNHFFPAGICIGSERGDDRIGILANRGVSGKTLFYLCNSGHCNLPAESIDELFQQLENG